MRPAGEGEGGSASAGLGAPSPLGALLAAPSPARRP